MPHQDPPRPGGDQDDRHTEVAEIEEAAETIVVPITEAIDLHHFHPSEILDVVDAYLDAAIEKGIYEVRLIHGRGKGVQRARVRQLLSEDPRVERYEEAPHDRGGWGATLAWLRTPSH